VTHRLALDKSETWRQLDWCKMAFDQQIDIEPPSQALSVQTFEHCFVYRLR